MAGFRRRVADRRVTARHGAAVGPTTYNQSVSGSLSFSGAAPTFAMTRSLAGALTFSGAAVKFAMARSLAGSITPTGALTRVFTGFRTLTGALSFSGAAVKFAMTRSLVGAVFTPTGTRSSAATRLRTLTGAVFTPTGAVARSVARRVSGLFAPIGSIASHAPSHLTQALSSALSFIGGTNQYPDPALYPSDQQYPYGGAILFQLNRTLSGMLQPAGAVARNARSSALTFAAVLQPQVVFFKVSARVLLSASFASGSLVATRVAHNVFQSLFASLRAAGAMSTVVNPGYVPPGGGGWGMPMPDEFFMRYKPTLRRQRMKV